MSDAELAVVILAAGAGTRMKSKTPKVLHPLAGRPLIGHVIRTATSIGASRVVAVVRHERDAVAGAISALDDSIETVDQDEIPGTGRAVEIAISRSLDGFHGRVVVLSGDVPLMSADTVDELQRIHAEKGNQLTVLSADVADATGLGRVVRDETGGFLGIVEHKDASELELEIAEINSGVYVFDADALRSALERVTLANAQGEKYLTDVAAIIRSDGGRISAERVRDVWEVQGANDRVQLAALAGEANRRILERHMRAGVTIIDPLSTWIDDDVSIGEDSMILPGTQLYGATTIGSDVQIGPDTTILDSRIGDGSVIERAKVVLSEIEERVTVGPFASLRAGTTLRADAHVGTSVEIKNAEIGPGAKVPHLSYIGDAEVGPGANIGAGGITSNWDGSAKHRTVIGAQARTGSHSVFVAPVELGAGAYTAAGAIIRKPVPPGALGISVAPQRNLEGWTLKKRAGSAPAEAAQRAIDAQQEEA